jgi:hypothetical protein
MLVDALKDARAVLLGSHIIQARKWALASPWFSMARLSRHRDVSKSRQIHRELEYERQIETRPEYPALGRESSQIQEQDERLLSTIAHGTLARDLFAAMDWMQTGRHKHRRRLEGAFCKFFRKAQNPGMPDSQPWREKQSIAQGIDHRYVLLYALDFLFSSSASWSFRIPAAGPHALPETLHG